MSLKLILLLLPLVHCRITVNILASTSSSEATVEAIGSNSEVISNIERGTFKITDKDLKDAAKKFSGGKPADVYVKSPTPWNDLYITYKWKEVRRILEPNNARIKAVTSETLNIYKQEFENNSTVTTTFRTGIAQEAQDTIVSKWEKTGNITVDEYISYSISFAANIGGAGRIVFKKSWGRDYTESRAILIGNAAAIDIVLEPGQSVTAMLTANQGIVDVEIDYAASLVGDIACNYPKAYNGHHFWAYNIDKVLEAARLPREIISKQIIQVKFYTDAKITVMDTASRLKLIEVPVDIIISK